MLFFLFKVCARSGSGYIRENLHARIIFERNNCLWVHYTKNWVSIEITKVRINHIPHEVYIFVQTNENFDRCYYSHNKFLDAVIALADFSKDGWKMSKSRVNLSIDHILVAGKQLTFILKYKKKLLGINLYNIKSEIIIFLLKSKSLVVFMVTCMH